MKENISKVQHDLPPLSEELIDIIFHTASDPLTFFLFFVLKDRNDYFSFHSALNCWNSIGMTYVK